jgi:MarR family transcriptional regulator for hemolysin
MAESPFEGTVTRELIHAAKSLRAYFQQVLASEGESLSTFLVLDVVARGEGRRQREIADGIRIEGATMTKHLDRLEAEGLVARRRDPSDRRAILIDLTPTGRSTHRRLLEITRGAHDACWAGISDRDRAATKRTAMLVSENIAALGVPELALRRAANG